MVFNPFTAESFMFKAKPTRLHWSAWSQQERKGEYLSAGKRVATETHIKKLHYEFIFVPIVVQILFQMIS